MALLRSSESIGLMVLLIADLLGTIVKIPFATVRLPMATQLLLYMCM